MTNADVGAVGEQLVAFWFARRGAKVYFPLGVLDGADLAVDVGCRMYKIQVKTASGGTKIEFRLRKNKDQPYEPEALDLYALVSLDPPDVALVPYRPGTSLTIDFENLRPEWDFDYVFEQMREGGLV